jgi:hypothetical protein
MNTNSPRRIGLPFLPNFTTFISHGYFRFATYRTNPAFSSSAYHLLTLALPRPIAVDRESSNYVIDTTAIFHTFDDSISLGVSLDTYHSLTFKVPRDPKRQPSTAACTSPAKAIPSARGQTSRGQSQLAGGDRSLSVIPCRIKQRSPNPCPNNPIL